MSKYSSLRSAITAAIYENVNESITGDVLQAKMLDIVNALDLGSLFLDVANASTVPNAEANGFYLALTGGTYANFLTPGGTAITVENREIAIIVTSGNAWSKVRILKLTSTVTENSEEVPDGGAVFNALAQKQPLLTAGAGITINKDNQISATVVVANPTGETPDEPLESLKVGNSVYSIPSGGGTTDYEELENKPYINGIELVGSKTSEDLGLQTTIVSGTTNLYDKDASDIMNNAYMLVQNGVLNYLYNETYRVSGFIRVMPGLTYTSVRPQGYAFFDENKIYIANTFKQTTGGIGNFVVPSNAAYLRLTFAKEYDDENRLFIGDYTWGTIPPYVAFGEGLKLELPFTALAGHSQVQNMMGGLVKRYKAASLGDGATLTLSNFPRFLSQGNVIHFSGKFDSWNGTLKVGKGFADYTSDWIEIDSANVVLKHHADNDSTFMTEAHGLTLSTFVDVMIQQGARDITITIVTFGGQYTKTVTRTDNFGNFIGIPKAQSVGLSLSDCQIAASNSMAKSSVWMFGDSYFGLTNTSRVMYWLREWGISDNVLIQAYPGERSDYAYPDLVRAVENFGAPRYLIWALGMNDDNSSELSNIATSDSVWYSNLQSVISLCKSYEITLIPATIPQVRSANYKNKDLMSAWIRASGYDYVDVAAAVGSNAEGLWYGNGTQSDYQSSDNVHPTRLGARAIAMAYAAFVQSIKKQAAGGSTVELAVSITYAALKALRDGNNLVPGTWYRITDYACTTTQQDTQSANHAFDIIVRADDESHLNENAFAAHHDGDT